MRTIVKTAVEFSYVGDNIERAIKKCYEDYKSIFPKEVSSSLKVFPTVVQALKLLKAKGTKMAIVTGMENEEARFVLEAANLLQYFDAVVTRDKITNPRPNPEGLFLAMQTLGLKKNDNNNCVYVGDTVADIQMAKNAKIKVVCVKTGSQGNRMLEKANPDYFVEDFSDMLEQLSRLPD